jgi:tetratricopeptide (TPR) repeat protein
MDKNAMKDLDKVISAHYEDISKHMGYTVLPPEEWVNQLGYQMLMFGSPNRALSLFSLNIKNYPNSANAFDSMGDYYLNQKDNTNAAEYYKKSLALNENADTRKKLDDLQKKD